MSRQTSLSNESQHEGVRLILNITIQLLTYHAGIWIFFETRFLREDYFLGDNTQWKPMYAQMSFVQHTGWKMQEAPDRIVSRLRICSQFSGMFEKCVLERNTYCNTYLSIKQLCLCSLTEMGQPFLWKARLNFQSPVTWILRLTEFSTHFNLGLLQLTNVFWSLNPPAWWMQLKPIVLL